MSWLGVKFGKLKFEQNHSVLSKGTKDENDACNHPSFNGCEEEKEIDQKD